MVTGNVKNDQPFLFDYLYRWKAKSFPDDHRLYNKALNKTEVIIAYEVHKLWKDLTIYVLKSLSAIILLPPNIWNSNKSHLKPEWCLESKWFSKYFVQPWIIDPHYSTKLWSSLWKKSINPTPSFGCRQRKRIINQHGPFEKYEK